eukprot:TRINITY_DN14516_c0_g1_i2.p2 TRINITY_DN14516_c0_g1~~TRINITY_DN14516_c0_g1_i2.p2  ORF type:complete len:130 (+),score=16.18 TRINITY_DN14516_c0_g1_i2:313-702(+)
MAGAGQHSKRAPQVAGEWLACLNGNTLRTVHDEISVSCRILDDKKRRQEKSEEKKKKKKKKKIPSFFPGSLKKIKAPDAKKKQKVQVARTQKKKKRHTVQTPSHKKKRQAQPKLQEKQYTVRNYTNQPQ